MAKLLTVVIVSLSLLLGSCATQVQSKADCEPQPKGKYEKMSMEELKRELVELQREYIVLARELRDAKRKSTMAIAAYNRASEMEDGKLDLLFRKLEADASKALAQDVFDRTSDDFKAAQKAYMKLLMNEQRTN